MERIHSVTTTRMLAAGPVGLAGPHKLYWLLSDPSGPNNAAALSDATIAAQPIVLDGFEAQQQSFFMNLNPPMQFIKGIYLETFTAMTSITFGYI